MKYIAEKLHLELYLRAKSLLELHKDEVALLDKPLDPDILTLLASDNLTCYIENSEGEIIGYTLYIITRHLHYDMKIAYQDVIYLHPDYRKGTTGIKLIKFSERHLKDLGVEQILQTTKRKRDLSKLYEYLGYKEMDIVFSKEI